MTSWADKVNMCNKVVAMMTHLEYPVTICLQGLRR